MKLRSWNWSGLPQIVISIVILSIYSFLVLRSLFIFCIVFTLVNVLYREPFFSFSFVYGIWTMTWQLSEFLPFFTIVLSTTYLRFGPSLPLDPWILTWTLSFFCYTTFLWNMVCFFTIRSSILFLLYFTLSRSFLFFFFLSRKFLADGNILNIVWYSAIVNFERAFLRQLFPC